MKTKTKEEVLALLVSLGTTSQEVADKLLSLGIRGDRNKCKTCPIAQYLVAYGVVTWSGLGIAIGPTPWNTYWYNIREYPQLKGILAFIEHFDEGKYPKLILRSLSK
jgi:hypothetical protein